MHYLSMAFVLSLVTAGIVVVVLVCQTMYVTDPALAISAAVLMVSNIICRVPELTERLL